MNKSQYKMNESQYKWGKEKVKKYAKKHKLTYLQAIHILEDTESIRYMYGWVNLQEFLRIEVNRLLFLLLQRKKNKK